MSVYIELYHGRTDKNENLDDWGTPGPVFGPFKSIHGTYKSTLRLMPIGKSEDECHLDYVDDLVYYGGVYYGDFTIFTEYELDADLRGRLVMHNADLAKRPVADRITQLRTELEAERISQGELCEIEAAAEQAGITITPEMMASDMLDEIEKAHATPDRKNHAVTLSNGQVLTIEEGEDEIHLAADMYICRIDSSGVLVMPNSGDATHSLTSGL